jgi:ankyrin repeat protein
LFLQVGANRERQSELGRTALMLAAQNGHLEVVKVLLQAGVDREKQDKDGYTALMQAAINGRLELVKFLVQTGVDREKRDKKGKTALDLAKTEEIKQLLRSFPPPSPYCAAVPV